MTFAVRLCGFGILMLLVGCIHTKAGTHVELVEQDGVNVYVSGAAGPGISRTIACRNAIQRAAAAIGHRFAQEHDGIGDDVADELGASDGKPFLYEYANAQVLDASVQDISFDPSQSLCMATVRWKPPVFIKDAVLAYGKRMKAGEMKEVGDVPNAAATATPTSAPAAAVTPAAAVDDPCKSHKRSLLSAGETTSRLEAEFTECKRRTQGDEAPCYAYGERFKRAQSDEATARRNLERCKEVNQP
ncbi:MAG: hypothetical protein VX834_05965 [Myxococcota bacterium]|nr:hypothetical protein [Myxococcota bacterium]